MFQARGERAERGNWLLERLHISVLWKLNRGAGTQHAELNARSRNFAVKYLPLPPQVGHEELQLEITYDIPGVLTAFRVMDSFRHDFGKITERRAL